VVGEDGGGNGNSDVFDQPTAAAMFETARVIVTRSAGAAPLLRRRLKLGYNRAGRLIDQLEHAGIVETTKS
jgi:S-DNA-T family DNA segregation ATPase FtsK/SpoIIIE